MAEYPTTLAGWVEHCREQAARAIRAAERDITAADRHDRLAAEWSDVLAAATGHRNTAASHRANVAICHEQAADWRALAGLVHAAREPQTADAGDGPMVAAVARVAARLEVP
jgi:hypothetical protein